MHNYKVYHIFWSTDNEFTQLSKKKKKKKWQNETPCHRFHETCQDCRSLLLMIKNSTLSKSDKNRSSYGHSKFFIFVFIPAEKNSQIKTNNFDASQPHDLKSLYLGFCTHSTSKTTLSHQHKKTHVEVHFDL